MDIGLITQYATVGLVLIILQGLLSADNAMVMAVLVRPLPDDQRKKALFYGLVGALVLRFVAIFFASYLATIWELQALGRFISFMSRLKESSRHDRINTKYRTRLPHKKPHRTFGGPSLKSSSLI